MLEYQIEIKGDIFVLTVIGGDVSPTEIPGLMPLDLPHTDGLPVVVKGDGLNPILAAVIASALDAPWIAIWDARTKCAIVTRAKVCAINTASLGDLVKVE